MKQDYWDKKPSSFADTVQLVENYVRQAIIQEVRDKQLYYHGLDHALAVKRRANYIFQKIEPILARNKSPAEIERLESLVNLCGLAHDMVQIFEPNTTANSTRKRPVGLSETETANKLLKYIQKLNQKLAACQIDPLIMFGDRDLKIIRDAILATICTGDPLAGKVEYTFSPHSIYQPYLYNCKPKISIVGSIIALADLGALGMDGVENFLQDGILIFWEDNPHFKDLLLDRSSHSGNDLECDRDDETKAIAIAKMLATTRFIVNLAHERKARFELEISRFDEQIRQILRDNVFIHFTDENMQQIEARVPTHDNAGWSQLIDFFCLDKQLD
jgi:hypothetical protein